ncbi:MAG: DNA-processing protein DprA [Anaerolineae bacterium]|nr:DNA-processing protein DprA [Anaerolineae bacterium]
MTANSFLQPNTVKLPTLRQQQLHVLGDQAPHAVSLVGKNCLQEPGLVALICSAKAPASILLAVHDLAQQWRTGSQTILSGFHSTVEQEAFEILLRGPGQLVYCPARSLPRRLKPTWQAALAAGYLTLISPFPDTVRRATKETAVTRNRFMAALADTVLIAYAHPGSSTEQLAYEAKAWGKSVYVLPNSANHHLISRGISSWQSHLK